MANKVASRKSRSVVVVTFGSEDNFEMPSDLDYRDMQTRLETVRNPEDIKAMPTILAGNKTLKLVSETLVLIDGDKWVFKPTRSRRARPDIEEDPLVKRSITQLALNLAEGKPRFVLVPYYAKLEKSS